MTRVWFRAKFNKSTQLYHKTDTNHLTLHLTHNEFRWDSRTSALLFPLNNLQSTEKLQLNHSAIHITIQRTTTERFILVNVLAIQYTLYDRRFSMFPLSFPLVVIMTKRTPRRLILKTVHGKKYVYNLKLYISKAEIWVFRNNYFNFWRKYFWYKVFLNFRST